jgi:serine/threonine protein phosphatase PrpC
MEFQVTGGSVPGTEHTKPGKPGWTNNQDAFYWRRTENCIVAVVSDGCGSGSHSEVGAELSVRLLTEILSGAAERYVMQIFNQPEVEVTIDWERVKTLLLSHIAVLASAMGESFSQSVNDHFLFTIVGAVITPWNTFLFSAGDGIFIVNGEIVRLGPFPDNAPPYLAYSLTGSKLTDTKPELLQIKINRTMPTDELTSLVIGSDGVLDLIKAARKKLPHREEEVGDVSQLWVDDRHFTNSDAIRRRLALANKEGAEIVEEGIARVTGGLLPDDTTLIVIRRSPKQQKEKV